MFRKEKRLTLVLSSMITLVILSQLSFLGTRISIVCICAYPLFLLGIYYFSKVLISKEVCHSSVLNCLEESEFNVIDNIERLRLYFKNTSDVVEYLTHVDSRLLVYIFNDKVKFTRFNDFVSGALECLASFKNYYGNYYLDIDVLSLPQNERIPTMLSVAYLVGLEMEVEKENLYITIRQIDEGVMVNVTSKYSSNKSENPFSCKLLDIFSHNEFLLTGN